MTKRQKTIVVLAITGLGLILRLIFLVAMKHGWPGWDSPTIDSLYHHLWAKQIAAGHVFSGGAYFRAPLYPLLLGLIYAIFGVDFTTVRIIQHLLGLLTVPLTYLVGKRYFSDFIALAASFLVAVNGVLIYFESQLLLDFLTVILLLGLIYLLILALDRKNAWMFFAAGMVAGLFAITRPNILAVIPLICIWIFANYPSYRRAIKSSLYLILGTVLLVAPITLRNIIGGGDFVLIASQGGVNFYIGNNERADGYTALLPGFGHNWQYSDAEFEAAGALGKKPGTLKPSEVSDYFYDKALNFIFSSPGEFLKLLLKKSYMFWNGFEISNNNNLYFLTAYIGLSFFPLYLFSIISPLGLVGAVLCFRRGRRYWIFPFIIFGYMATVVAFFVTARFRLPLVPLLTLMAAFTAHEIIAAVIKRRIRYATIIIIFVLATGFFTWTDLYHHHDRSLAFAHYSLGNMLLKKGNREAAQRQFEEAISEAACVPNAHLNLGVIAFYNNDTATARNEFLSELQACGPSARAYNDLSLLARLAGENNHAYALADSCVELFPNFKEAYINRIIAAYATHDSALIQSAVYNFINEFPDNIAARYYHGALLAQIKEVAKARSEFEYVISSSDRDIVAEYDLSEIYSSSLPYGYDPRKIRGKAYYQLGLLDASGGDYAEAVAEFSRSLDLSPFDPDALSNRGLAYDHLKDYESAEKDFIRAISMDSTRAAYYFNYAMTLGKMGRYGEAAAKLEKALAIDPDLTQAREILTALKKHLK